VVNHAGGTGDGAYTRRLVRLESSWWKRALDVQRPYRWHLRRLRLGFVLDVGCGLGRNLLNLVKLGGSGVGVDHNVESVAAARARQLTAYTPEEFAASSYARPGRFDSLLLSHVVEHLYFDDALALVRQYLPYLRSGGQVVFITPQEAGHASDPTHVLFTDLPALERLAGALQLVPVRGYSFPFPRPAGKVFKYNEFVLLARKP
jgi:2-polyprenyl-3-methyl-5-hydroxy-6-metoxy-1,4-benzoquinol methylase